MFRRLFACLVAGIILCACQPLNDERIPMMPVYIDLSNPGIWSTYGVFGFGDFRYFIMEDRDPPGFPYTYNSATGYGGVLLVGGQNAYTGEAGPLAYDLSCPVERMPDVRVFYDPNIMMAVCPVCRSIYDVVEAGGAPKDGPALGMHLAMTPYSVYGTNTGGVIISR